jgi:hypothetical protein
VLFERAQAHGGGGVLAGAEGHAGIDLDDDVPAFQPVLGPRRLDDEGAADALDAEVLFPGIAPGLVAQTARASPPRGSLERRHVQSEAKRTPDPFRVGSGWKVAGNDGRSVAVDRVGVCGGVEAGGRLDGDAAGTRLPEDIGGDLSVDAGDFNGDFEEGRWLLVWWHVWRPKGAPVH